MLQFSSLPRMLIPHNIVRRTRLVQYFQLPIRGVRMVSTARVARPVNIGLFIYAGSSKYAAIEYSTRI